MRAFGRLGEASALTLGGGGIGNVWGEVDRAEAVATVRAALESGVTMLDLAPTYGPGEAELVVGEALGGEKPDGVLVTTKVHPGDGDAPGRMRASLRESLERLRLERVDLFILHSQVRPDDRRHPGTVTLDQVRDVIRPEFLRLRDEGLIGGWGLTGVGPLDTLAELLGDDERPDGIQCVANALDLSGDMWLWGADDKPDNRRIREAATTAGVPVMAIRVVAAGSLADALDRPLEPDHPAARDFEAAAPFRRLAAERGEPAAVLAHRWALTEPGIATVVLGVKNREELDECVAAEAAGPLSDDDMRTIAALAATR